MALDGVHGATSYDAIVVGLGAMGSAAAYQLAKRGQRVLGLERFERGNALGSHHGESRITRKAYFEHPDYVPLLHRAYELWRALEAESGESLMRLIGGLFVGPANGALVTGSRLSAEQHGLAHELLNSDELRRRFPALQPADDEVAVFEPDAGVLFPERCVDAHLGLAERSWATLRFNSPVLTWRADGEGVVVETAAGTYSAERLVLAAGAWMTSLLADLPLSLQVERMAVFWLEPRQAPDAFEPDRLPVWIWETRDLGFYYGVPHLQSPGAKLARHHGGRLVPNVDEVDRLVTAADEQVVRRFVRRSFPSLDGPVASSTVCLYTNTLDEHFVVDWHPAYPQVTLASACSGHGFKFSPVIGEVVADLVLEGRASPHAAFLRLERFAHLAEAHGQTAWEARADRDT